MHVKYKYKVIIYTQLVPSLSWRKFLSPWLEISQLGWEVLRKQYFNDIHYKTPIMLKLISSLEPNYKDCPGSSVVNNLPAMQETQETRVQSLGQEDPLEKDMATHSSILARKILWTEQPNGLQSSNSVTKSGARLSDWAQHWAQRKNNNRQIGNKMKLHFFSYKLAWLNDNNPFNEVIELWVFVLNICYYLLLPCCA